MATETKTATEEVKIDLFEDDDEFEEFEINEGGSEEVCSAASFESSHEQCNSALRKEIRVLWFSVDMFTL
ncbi:hypothetical protein SDJN02_18789 [Cucurbita argyrosperma subsp. argyrosperma]|nr:hypothetical protein SDJN02_18789 [Cucurbita argyrosperma subsp. argyrosperma]